MTQETKYDPSVRLALECDASLFKLDTSNDLFAPIVKRIQKRLTNGAPIKLQLHKLNIYSVGGFFKSHVDTPVDARMIGTLILGFPTKLKGSAFN